MTTTIAMWSGPRNISTALLRSWGSRSDTVVTDEPLYAHYLAATGADHPGREEILAVHESDWRAVVEDLTGPPPDAKPIWYQKHMAHHLTTEVERDWIRKLTNCLLIRDPAEMITSYIQIVPEPRPEDLGLPQQLELYRLLAEEGDPPPVIDARDVLGDPAGALSRLCDALGVPYDRAMLSWEPGTRFTDGVWGRYWYSAVEASTGFEPYRPKPDRVPTPLRPVERACREIYDELYAHRITAGC